MSVQTYCGGGVYAYWENREVRKGGGGIETWSESRAGDIGVADLSTY